MPQGTLPLVLGGIPGLLMLGPALGKLARAKVFVANMAEIHFTGPKLVAVGAAEVVFGVLAIVPATRNLGLCLIVLDMAGAAGSHLGAGQPPGKAAPSIVFGAIAFGALLAHAEPALRALLWP